VSDDELEAALASEADSDEGAPEAVAA